VEGPALMVVKKDGKREPFNRQKLAQGIEKAFQKRPVSTKELEVLMDACEREVLRKGSGEIPSKTIGKMVLRRIKKLDKVAWLRFASVYLEFEDLGDFEKAINN
jgi:transcriptional repressor NrdR